ncbi:hypothetical protein EDD85DRAFT_785037 [Armillaria nabsnona]|nr:hypothetical protein EDD85DRAFT_785037 [Armillaria nabsnona]
MIDSKKATDHHLARTFYTFLLSSSLISKLGMMPDCHIPTQSTGGVQDARYSGQKGSASHHRRATGSVSKDRKTTTHSCKHIQITGMGGEAFKEMTAWIMEAWLKLGLFLRLGVDPRGIPPVACAKRDLIHMEDNKVRFYTSKLDEEGERSMIWNADEYTAETYGERVWLVPIKNRIVFEGDAPPDPGYLHLHACVADVLQRSGAGKVIDKILRCLPEQKCPADLVDLQRVLDILELRYSLVAAFKLPVCRDVPF